MLCTIDHEISPIMNKCNSKKQTSAFYSIILGFFKDFYPFDYHLNQIPDNLDSLMILVVFIIRKLLSFSLRQIVIDYS